MTDDYLTPAARQLFEALTPERAPLDGQLTRETCNREYLRAVNAELQQLTRDAYDRHYANLAFEHKRFTAELEDLTRLRVLRLSAVSEHKDS